MNEEQQKIIKNFTTLEEDLIDSPFKENFSILREAWNIEISKPGCTQCLKNGAMAKYSQIAQNMIMHDLDIEQAKEVHDYRNKLSEKHREVAQEINDSVNAKISEMKTPTNSE